MSRTRRSPETSGKGYTSHRNKDARRRDRKRKRGEQ